MTYGQVRENIRIPVHVSKDTGPKPILPPLNMVVGYVSLGGMPFSVQQTSTAALEFETKRMLDRFSFEGISIGNSVAATPRTGNNTNGVLSIIQSSSLPQAGFEQQGQLSNDAITNTYIPGPTLQGQGRSEENILGKTATRRRKSAATKNTTVKSTGLPLEARKKHFCKICARGFTTSGHLARHNRIHTGEKRHVCHYPGCLQRFSRHDNCTQHYRTHFRNSNTKTSSVQPSR